VADDEDTLDTYIESYCENYLDDLTSRTEFVEALKDVDEDDFYNTCEEYLSTSESINIWFDPIDPLTSISQTEICDLHYILFESLASKGITSLAEYVAFSYLVSLDLYLNAYE
jgi:hypothetical protein